MKLRKEYIEKLAHVEDVHCTTHFPNAVHAELGNPHVYGLDSQSRGGDRANSRSTRGVIAHREVLQSKKGHEGFSAMFGIQ